MNRDINILTQLQKNVAKEFGKQICTATDCDQLRRILKAQFNANLSSQTLRRFFGLIKSDSKSSHFTLDLLSRYCRFLDFKDFRTSYSEIQLELFFTDTCNCDVDYWQKSEMLCRQITDSPELLVNTHHRLMAFPMVRKYFIENHPLRDLIGTVYSQYFLAYLKFNQSSEAKIFAYGFLFQSAFLQQNEELMELYFKKVKDTALSEKVHVIPAGLKYGVQLLYADFTGNEYLFRKYFAEMKKARLIYQESSEKSVCSFENTVLESLIFTKRTKEMKFLIDHHTFQKDHDQSFIPSERKKTHEEVWNILCAAAYQKMDDHLKAEDFLKRTNLENLGIGWKKYYSIMYYFVELKATEASNQKPIISKLRILINETFFSYYEDLLNDYLEASPEKMPQENELHKSEILAIS